MNPSKPNELIQLFNNLIEVKNISESIQGNKKHQFDTVMFKNLIQTEPSVWSSVQYKMNARTRLAA